MDQVLLHATTWINLTNIMLSEQVKHKIGLTVWFHLYKFQKQANESIRNQDGGCLRCKGLPLERGAVSTPGLLGMLYFLIWMLLPWVWGLPFVKHRLSHTVWCVHFYLRMLCFNKKHTKKWTEMVSCGWHIVGNHPSQLLCVLLGNMKWRVYKKISKLACSSNSPMLLWLHWKKTRREFWLQFTVGNSTC